MTGWTIPCFARPCGDVKMSFCLFVKSVGARIARTGMRRGTGEDTRFSRHYGDAGWHGFPASAFVLPRRKRLCADKLRRRVGRKGKRRTKSQPDFVRSEAPSRREILSEAPVSLVFRLLGNCFAAGFFRLCGKKFISFSKEISFCAVKNGRRGREMHHTSISLPRFLTVHVFLASFQRVLLKGGNPKICLFAGFRPVPVTFCSG